MYNERKNSQEITDKMIESEMNASKLSGNLTSNRKIKE